MVVWVQNDCECAHVYPPDRPADWELWLAAAAWRL